MLLNGLYGRVFIVVGLLYDVANVCYEGERIEKVLFNVQDEKVS